MSRPEFLWDLTVFVAVVDAQSFTAAADKLLLSKSMVSKCVGRLEQTLGARLLNRTTRRLHLTEAGSALYETAKGALTAVEEAEAAVSSIQGAARGLLKVSASPAFGGVVLPRVVREVMDAHPDLAIELILEDRHVDLVKEGVDIALRITSAPPDSRLVYRRLGPNRQVICASPDYLRRRGTPTAPQDLKEHDCIAHTQRATPRTWELTSATGARISIPITPRLAVTTALALRGCALEGLGIVEVNSYLVADDIGAGRLVRLLEAFRPKELSVYAVFPERRYLAPKVRVFIDAMAEMMSPEPYWDRRLAARNAEGAGRPPKPARKRPASSPLRG